MSGTPPVKRDVAAAMLAPDLHPGVRDPEPKPADAILIDLMLDWAPNEAVRNRIFVDNAAKLYDFPKS